MFVIFFQRFSALNSNKIRKFAALDISLTKRCIRDAVVLEMASWSKISREDSRAFEGDKFNCMINRGVYNLAGLEVFA